MAKSKEGNAIMKLQIKTPKKETACVSAQTAEKTKTHKTFYRTLPVTSNLKLQIGQLLLLLLAGDRQPDGWQRFDQLLRQFYAGGVL